MDLSKLPRLSGKKADETPPSSPDAWASHAPVSVQRGRFCAQCGQPLRERARFCDSCGAPTQAGPGPVSVGTGAEAWICLVLGVVFMLMGWSFARYAAATIRGDTYHTQVFWQTGEKAGQEVDYYELEGFAGWTNTGVFLFGVAMVFEAVVLLAARGAGVMPRALVIAALLATLAATAFNLHVAVKVGTGGVIPIISVLAVGFGVYIALYQVAVLRAMFAAARRDLG